MNAELTQESSSINPQIDSQIGVLDVVFDRQDNLDYI